VRSLQVSGLGYKEAQEILKAKGLVSSEDEYRELIGHYTSNPLALKIAATTIQSLFDGNISKFLAQGTTVFGEIWELLDKQFHRLSTSEKQVMQWLAINRKLIPLSQLQEDIVPTLSHRELLEALESLQQRSLIEGHLDSFSQQSIVMEYMTERLISQCYAERTDEEPYSGSPNLLGSRISDKQVLVTFKDKIQ
jgi:hypothetical protein